MKTYYKCSILAVSVFSAVSAFAGAEPTPTSATQDPNELTLLFTYGSEKEIWLKAVTKTFNAGGFKTPSGKKIKVNDVPMGSGTCIRTLVEEELHPDLVSPASSVFVQLANGRTKDDKPIIGSTRSLVKSPVVIAMWKKMAAAIGHGKKPIGWADLFDLVGQQQGWSAYGLPEAGRFKFGHTHPEMSNSGIQSLIAITYAGAAKTQNLTVDDVKRPETAEFIRTIESGVVHYGESTGFFGRKMFKYGPENLSAAILYENMVIESYDPKYKLKDQIVAIYPKEGTLVCDNPVGIVNKPWVNNDRRDACKIYLDFLMARPQQELAMKSGFRPGDASIPLSSDFGEARGVDPNEPKQLLEVPSRSVTEAILDVWRNNKRTANVVLAIDVSGSMLEDDKIGKALVAAEKIVEMLHDNDFLSILAFGTDVTWVGKDLKMKTDRKQAAAMIRGLKPLGKTSLYDAVAQAHAHFEQYPHPGSIRAVITLSDGEDTTSNFSQDQMLRAIKFQPEKLPVLIFTVAYGKDADREALKLIADQTQAETWVGDAGNIDAIMMKASAFFSSRIVEK